ncbi:hypothetical protein MJ561_03875 [Klebsiella pneumoniae]|nr:hypothetical protein MJ561_03875 [Klebsiella pneumoniae]
MRLHESKDPEKLEPAAFAALYHPLLDMKGNPSSGGIWAPAARLLGHDGQFWLVLTDVKVTEGAFEHDQRYLTTAKDIRGRGATRSG